MDSGEFGLRVVGLLFASRGHVDTWVNCTLPDESQSKSEHQSGRLRSHDTEHKIIIGIIGGKMQTIKRNLCFIIDINYRAHKSLRNQHLILVL